MTVSHGPLEPPFRPRDARTPAWPGGARVAVWPVVNIEHYPQGSQGPALQPHLAHGHDIANHNWRDYGNRAGVFRLFTLFAELGIPATAALNAEICLRHPEIVEEVKGNDWDVMAHGWENSTRHSDLSPQTEAEVIERSLRVLQDGTERPVRGWLTPGFAVSDHTWDLLSAAGVRYVADLGNDDVPYWWKRPAGRLLVLPYSMETNDITLFLSLRQTPAQFADALVEQVRTLAAEPHGGRVVALGLHPFLVGQPGRIGALRRCLEEIAALPHVRWTTGAALFRHLCEDDPG